MSPLKLPFGNRPPQPNPRLRRLQSDHQRLLQLAETSSIFSFTVPEPQRPLGAPETYRIRFEASGLRSSRGPEGLKIIQAPNHEILIQLIAEYPRAAPHMRWLTPIFHPNISESGAVCLGGWGTNWAPSLHLDKLCEMLWDMARFANYDTRSPFNHLAAQWLRSQRQFRFPIDQRELRNRPPVEPLIADRNTTVPTISANVHPVLLPSEIRSIEAGQSEIIFEATLAEPVGPVQQIENQPPRTGTDEIRFLD